MNRSNSATPNTPTALEKARRLTTVLLAATSSSFEIISSATALEAAQKLQKENHAQDEQLASLLWLFPIEQRHQLAPSYLLPVIDMLPALWKDCLLQLDRKPNEQTPALDLTRVPQLARTIVATYLCVLSKHGIRQVYDTSAGTNTAPSLKQFLSNFHNLALAFTQNCADMTADYLLSSVCAAIERADLSFDLLPESTWVWEISEAEHEPQEYPGDNLAHLQTFLRKFWLTTGSYSEPHPLARQVFYVRDEADHSGMQGAIDRLMASIAVRFPSLFVIRKERFTQKHRQACWSRCAILSWHGGLAFDSRHKCLLESQSADPLTEFFRFADIPSLDDQRRQLTQLTVRKD